MRKEGVLLVLTLLMSLSFVSATAITDDLHITVQSTNSSGSIQTGTYAFAFNLTTDAACTTVVYSNLTTLATDDRGIVDVYLPDVTLTYEQQYWLCYYRDGTLKNTVKIAKIPYSFRAKYVNSSGIEADASITLTGYNITADNFFGSLNASYIRNNYWYNSSNPSNYIDWAAVLNGTLVSNTTLTTYLGNKIDWANVLNGTLWATNYNGTLAKTDATNTFGAFNQSFNAGAFFFDAVTNRTGIGTSTPQNLLNVLGDANITGILYRNNLPLIDWTEATNGTLASNSTLTTYLGNKIDWGNAVNGTLVSNTTLTTYLGNKIDWGNAVNGTLASNTTLTTYLGNKIDWANVLNGTLWATNYNGTLAKTDASNTFGAFNQSFNAGAFFFDAVTNRTGIGTSSPQQTLNVLGDLNATGTVYSAVGNLSVGYQYATNSSFIGWANAVNGTLAVNSTIASYIDAKDTEFNTSLKNYADASFVTLGGDSVTGTYDFNGGWQSSGLTIQNGDIYAQTGFFYNITSLAVNNLAINGSMIPQAGWDNVFDIGNSTFRWRDLSLGRNAYINGSIAVDTNVTIGSSGNFILSGKVASNLIPINNVRDLGSSANRWQTLYVDLIDANNLSASGGISIAGTQFGTFTIFTNNTGDDVNNASLAFELGSPVTNAVILWDSSANRFNFNFPVYSDTIYAEVGNLSVGYQYATNSSYISWATAYNGTLAKTDASNTFGAFNQSFNAGAFFFDAVTNRTGIGTSAPKFTLDVIGSINVSDAFIFSDGSTQPYAATPNGFSWSVGTSSFVRNMTTPEDLSVDIFFKPDGTKLYIVGQTGDKISEYSLSTPWNIGTSSFIQNMTASENTVYGLFFKPDGTKLYMAGTTGDKISEYSLSTPWDISTTSFVQNMTSPEDISVNLFFKPDGTKLYLSGSTGDQISEYSLSTPWNIGTSSFIQNMTAIEDTSRGLFFKPDGTKLYVIGVTGDKISEYDLGLAVLGKIGIGTSTPQNLLNVLGDANITGILYRNNLPLIDWTEATNGTLASNSTLTTYLGNKIDWGNAVNGTLVSNTTLTTYLGNKIDWGNAVNGTLASNTTLTTYLGNKIDWANVLNGTLWATAYNGTLAKTDASNTFGAFNQSFNAGAFFFDAVTNRTGIGTTNPQQTLNVVGALNTTNAGANSTIGTTTIFDYNSTCSGFRFGTTGGMILSCS